MRSPQPRKGIPLKESFTVIALLMIALAAPGLDDKAIQAIVAQGEASLDAGPYSVMDKTGTAPSGDKHDFLTMSPYFWPNPRKDDGLPYIMRDGRLNPEANSDRFDRVNFFEMGKHARRLGLAYRITGEAKYADRAALLIRTWFLDDSTRMNPHLEYAQWRPGRDGGTPSGIIRGMTLLEVHEVTRWIHESNAWTEEDEQKWQAWVRDYRDWLVESELGTKESEARNNHGTWYDVQVVTFSLYVGDQRLAESILQGVMHNRIAKQINPDGTQPKELIRTKSWDYSVMNLRAFMHLALLAKSVDIDLFDFRTPECGRIRDAVNYLIPFAIEGHGWPHDQIKDFDAESFTPVLLMAHEVSPDTGYDEYAEKIDVTGEYHAMYAVERGEIRGH